MQKEVDASLKLQKEFDQIIKQGTASVGSNIAIEERLKKMQSTIDHLDDYGIDDLTFAKYRAEINTRLNQIEDTERLRADCIYAFYLGSLGGIAIVSIINIIKHFVDIKVIFK